MPRAAAAERRRGGARCVAAARRRARHRAAAKHARRHAGAPWAHARPTWALARRGHGRPTRAKAPPRAATAAPGGGGSTHPRPGQVPPPGWLPPAGPWQTTAAAWDGTALMHTHPLGGRAQRTAPRWGCGGSNVGGAVARDVGPPATTVVGGPTSHTTWLWLPPPLEGKVSERARVALSARNVIHEGSGSLRPSRDSSAGARAPVTYVAGATQRANSDAARQAASLLAPLSAVAHPPTA